MRRNSSPLCRMEEVKARGEEIAGCSHVCGWALPDQITERLLFGDSGEADCPRPAVLLSHRGGRKNAASCGLVHRWRCLMSWNAPAAPHAVAGAERAERSDCCRNKALKIA
ncbi:hypothetical protein KCP73_17515 [Salmonella enterica subsp. enterica]|nr:hypothetical protein KCP73_17515 [Salmonella enterica subsp. enterica]